MSRPPSLGHAMAHCSPDTAADIADGEKAVVSEGGVAVEPGRTVAEQRNPRTEETETNNE